MKFTIDMTEDEATQEAGSRLRQLRLSRNITQAELAERAGVSKRSLERLEKGSGGLRLDVFFAVCVALGVLPKFEVALPQVELLPQDVLEKRALPKRARKKNAIVIVRGADNR